MCEPGERAAGQSQHEYTGLVETGESLSQNFLYQFTVGGTSGSRHALGLVFWSTKTQHISLPISGLAPFYD